MKLFDVWLVYHKLLLANSCGMQDMASAKLKINTVRWEGIRTSLLVA